MRITSNYHITKSRNGNYWTNMIDGKWRQCTSEEEYEISAIYKTFKHSMNEEYKKRIIEQFFENHHTNTTSTETSVIDKNEIEKTIQNIINFFSEFEFEPNFRFLNTFAYACTSSMKDATDYIENYFALTDSPFINDIKEKMKSAEFKFIYEGLKNVTPTTKVNNRFKLYYGSQGTGKTTEALNETSTVMVCHSAMLPSDLMEDFKFEDGKATFNPSALQKAMVEGTTILLDEINLLPFESLRFLQSILDGKKTISYKGKNIEIKDGFKIIGTMNLKVNGATYALPEPLIDRAETLKKFNLTAKSLVSAII